MRGPLSPLPAAQFDVYSTVAAANRPQPQLSCPPQPRGPRTGPPPSAPSLRTGALGTAQEQCSPHRTATRRNTTRVLTVLYVHVPPLAALPPLQHLVRSHPSRLRCLVCVCRSPTPLHDTKGNLCLPSPSIYYSLSTFVPLPSFVLFFLPFAVLLRFLSQIPVFSSSSVAPLASTHLQLHCLPLVYR